MRQGLIHIYCGDGKGKTTAALGLALRALGHGWRVLLVQFLKAAATGELTAIASLPGCKVLRGQKGRAFALQMNEQEKAELMVEQGRLLDAALEQGGEYDLLILDEAIGAIRRGLVDQERLLTFLSTKPTALEVVLTGRNPNPQLLELADYVSEIQKVRHPFDRGIAARDGIER